MRSICKTVALTLLALSLCAWANRAGADIHFVIRGGGGNYVKYHSSSYFYSGQGEGCAVCGRWSIYSLPVFYAGFFGGHGFVTFTSYQPVLVSRHYPVIIVSRPRMIYVPAYRESRPVPVVNFHKSHWDGFRRDLAQRREFHRDDFNKDGVVDKVEAKTAPDVRRILRNQYQLMPRTGRTTERTTRTPEHTSTSPYLTKKSAEREQRAAVESIRVLNRQKQDNGNSLPRGITKPPSRSAAQINRR